MKKRVKEPALVAGSIIIWIIIWQIGATLANRNLMIKIPLPLETLSAFFQNCLKIKFWQAVSVSVLRIVSGFLMAVLIGIIGGMLAGYSKLFKVFFSPILHLARTVPVAAFIILAWLWIPSRMLPSVISFLMVLPIVWSHIEAGLLSVDKNLIEMARVFGMTRFESTVRIELPLILPQIRAGCISGLGIAWKSGIAAEIISSPTGSLGSLLSSAKSGIDYVQVFAVTLMVVILSLILEKLLAFVWKEQKR